MPSSCNVVWSTYLHAIRLYSERYACADVILLFKARSTESDCVSLHVHKNISCSTCKKTGAHSSTGQVRGWEGPRRWWRQQHVWEGCHRRPVPARTGVTYIQILPFILNSDTIYCASCNVSITLMNCFTLNYTQIQVYIYIVHYPTHQYRVRSIISMKVASTNKACITKWVRTVPTMPSMPGRGGPHLPAETGPRKLGAWALNWTVVIK